MAEQQLSCAYAVASGAGGEEYRVVRLEQKAFKASIDVAVSKGDSILTKFKIMLSTQKKGQTEVVLQFQCAFQTLL